jgi:ribose 1,5-bisphosphokinase PhnN
LRAKRRANRGRETACNIKKRLARALIEIPKGIPANQIPNNGTVAKGIMATTKLLKELAE